MARGSDYLQRKRYIVIDILVRQQSKILEHGPNLATHERHPTLGHRGQVLAEHLHTP